MLKKHLLTALKIVISLFVLIVMFHEVHFAQLLPYLESMSLNYYLLAILTLLMTNFVASYRWTIMMKQLGMPESLGFYTSSYFQGAMFNQILPTSIGGDAYRVLLTSKKGYSKRDSINGVLTDRIYGFAGLVVINLAVLGSAFQLYTLHIFLGVLTTLLGCVTLVVGLACFHRLKITFLQTRLRWIYDLSLSLHHSYKSWSDFGWRALLGIIPNFFSICSIAFIGQAVHIQAHLIDFFIFIPSVVLLTMVPISMAGWGVREGAMVFLGAAIGLPKPALLAISLLYGFMLIITSLPGLVLYVKQQHFSPQADMS